MLETPRMSEKKRTFPLSDGREKIASNKVALYQVMKADLEAAIRTGQFLPGEAVPSESELIAQYRVSSTTARRCLDELASEGLLERMRGRGTFVSELAGVLKRQRVAVVVKDFISIAHPFLATMVGTIEQTLEAANAHVVIIRAQVSKRESNLQLLDLVEHENIRHALILSNIAQTEVLPMVEAGISCLGVNIRYQDERIPYLSMDAAANSIAGLKELTDRGHRHIAIFIQEPAMQNAGVLNSTSLLRDAYKRACEKIPDMDKVPRVYKVNPDTSFTEQVKRALSERPAPTAFLCWDELAALEVMRAIQEEGLHVPRDISVVGIRLLPTSPIACVEAPLVEIAKAGAETMLRWIQGEPPKSRIFPPIGFSPRDTIAPVKQTVAQ